MLSLIANLFAEPVWAEFQFPENTANAAAKADAERRYADAERLYREALRETEVSGAGEEQIAQASFALGEALHRLGKYQEAEAYHRRALRLREKVLGTEHADTAASLNATALVLGHLGHYSDALPLAERALSLREKLLGADVPLCLLYTSDAADE